MINYKETAGYSYRFLLPIPVCFLLFVIIGILVSGIIFYTGPLKIVLLPLLIIIILIVVAGLIIGKYAFGITTIVQDDSIHIYKRNSFTLKPKKNEWIIWKGASGFFTSLYCTIDKIESVDRVVDSTIIDQLKSVSRAPCSLKIWFFRFLVNAKDLRKLLFVSDFTNIVEITVKDIAVHTRKETVTKSREKILVSVKDPERFIGLLSTK